MRVFLLNVFGYVLVCAFVCACFSFFFRSLVDYTCVVFVCVVVMHVFMVCVLYVVILCCVCSCYYQFVC